MRSRRSQPASLKGMLMLRSLSDRQTTVVHEKVQLLRSHGSGQAGRSGHPAHLINDLLGDAGLLRGVDLLSGDAPEVLLGDVSCPPCTTVGLVFLCVEAPLLT